MAQEKKITRDNKIDIMAKKAQNALCEYMLLDSEKTNKIVKAMAYAAMENRVRLAQMAFEETKRGVVEDKVIKNMFASEYVWNSIKNEKTVGIIDKNTEEGYTEIADPIGVVAGVTPVTNPTSTVIFKALICAKTRNPIIFGFHPGAQKCSEETAKILKEAAVNAGAPKDCIQWIKYPSVEETSYLMNHPDVDMVLATGGASMVKSAYSTGKPALGVGPGNVPCYIEKTADIKRACNDIILSKTFDNGMICASEQSVVVDEEICKEFEKTMQDNGCVFLNESEKDKLCKIAFNSQTNKLNPDIVGKSAYDIACMAKIEVPCNTKILLAKLNGVGKEFLLSMEKLSPVLAYYVAENSEVAFDICKKVLDFCGRGHTAVIHSENPEITENFALKMDAGRIIINSPSSHGAIGDIYNTNTPSLTLGCGSHGKNSTSENISCAQLINRKKVFSRRTNMQWFKVPPKIYFEKNSISYLESLENISKVFIITDSSMVNLGYTDKILYYLKKRENGCRVEIFSEVSPDPSVSVVMKGLERIKEFAPDCIIALGGGSAIDAAKAIWLFSESPEIEFEKLRSKFMDIRKRIYKYPMSHRKIKFVAIPTTSGTGSEVTSFAVITDSLEGKEIKYPLADYSLTPDIAIIDPSFVMSLPKSVTADTGMDVLTHAIEAYVSVMASDYTDGLCIQAVSLVRDYLKRAYDFGEKDSLAREKMHNASCIAGMAFTNAFLGINHSMAHKLGGEFKIPHGRANAVLLPYVIRYNASLPTKLTSFPKYKNFIADEKYANLARLLGEGGNTAKECTENLIKWIKLLNKHMGIPLTLKDAGICEEEFLKKVDALSEEAHQDQCTGTNPRYPLVSEIKDIYLKCYYGDN